MELKLSCNKYRPHQEWTLKTVSNEQVRDMTQWSKRLTAAYRDQGKAGQAASQLKTESIIINLIDWEVFERAG